MLQRSSCVSAVHIDIVSFASVVQLGDSSIINGFSRAIANQREVELFYGKEGNFSSYSVFSKPIPFLPINEAYSSITYNSNPLIKVNKIDIVGMSNSAVLHVGNSQHVSMEARIKHIRQLQPREEEQGQG